MYTILKCFFKNVFCYNANMNDTQMYLYFIADLRNNDRHAITTQFYNNIKGVQKDVIDKDVAAYRVRGNNNLAQLVIKYPQYTESQLQYTKFQMKRQLKEAYLIAGNIF